MEYCETDAENLLVSVAFFFAFHEMHFPDKIDVVFQQCNCHPEQMLSVEGGFKSSQAFFLTSKRIVTAPIIFSISSKYEEIISL